MVQASATAQVLIHPHHSIVTTPNFHSPEVSPSLEEFQQIWTAYRQGDISLGKRLLRELKRVVDKTLLDLAEKQHELSMIHSASSQAQSLHLRRMGKQFSKDAQALKKKNFDHHAMQKILQDLHDYWSCN